MTATPPPSEPDEFGIWTFTHDDGVLRHVWSGHMHATREAALAHRARIAAMDVETDRLNARARALGISDD